MELNLNIQEEIVLKMEKKQSKQKIHVSQLDRIYYY